MSEPMTSEIDAHPYIAHETSAGARFVWVSDSLCIDASRVVSARVTRAPLPRYAGQFLGGRRDVVLTLDTGKEHTVIAIDEDNRRRDFESYEPVEQRDRVEAAARTWIDGLLTGVIPPALTDPEVSR